MDNYHKRYYRTKNGLATDLFSSQRSHSKARNHTMPNYTKEEFKDWLFNHERFEELYQNWVNSDYDKWLRPSPDRIRDLEPYSFDNLELKTWAENNEDGRFSGATTNAREVHQYSLDKVFIMTHPSSSAAARHVNGNIANIAAASTGKLKTSSKFIWTRHLL